MDKKITIQEIEKIIKSEEIEYVDVRFLDLPGVQQHLTITANDFLETAYQNGLEFDGSSVRGFQSINESDMKLLPDIQTAYLDPFRNHPTLIVTFAVADPFTKKLYTRDSRFVAQKAEKYLQETGIADTAYFAPEAEFYIFDSVRYNTSINSSNYEVNSVEGSWNTNAEEYGENLGYKPRTKGGYFPVSPTDHFADLRDDIVENLLEAGLQIEKAHHEVGTGGQQEVNYKYNSLVAAGDDLVKFKYIVRNTVAEAGKTMTFLPKPLFGDNGSGMHCHQSLHKNGEPLFYKEGTYANLSDIARWYIGGLIKHAGALMAFTNPTVNSYHRLVKGFEAPTNLVYSARNRSAAIRIPIAGDSPFAKRIEFRCPDPSSNPYLAFSAQLMAGIDGIQNKIEPPKPVDKNIYELPAKEAAKIKTVPGSLDEALNALRNDQKFLLAGDVFTPDLLTAWIDLKSDEISQFAQRPHPYEFDLYYDI